jgi:hypothetical protein
MKIHLQLTVTSLQLTVTCPQVEEAGNIIWRLVQEGHARPPPRAGTFFFFRLFPAFSKVMTLRVDTWSECCESRKR